MLINLPFFLSMYLLETSRYIKDLSELRWYTLTATMRMDIALFTKIFSHSGKKGLSCGFSMKLSKYTVAPIEEALDPNFPPGGA